MQIDLFGSDEEIRMRETGVSSVCVEYQEEPGNQKEAADDARLT